MRLLCIVALAAASPTIASGFDCAETQQVPIWQQSACEFTSNSSELGDDALRQLAEWGPDAGMDALAIATFWSLQHGQQMIVVEWGDYSIGQGAELIAQVEIQAGFPLSALERAAFVVEGEAITLEGRGQQEIMLDAISPILARRGLAPLILHLNGPDFGIAIVPEDYACRWGDVEFEQGWGWGRWRGSDTFEMYPDTSTWSAEPNECVAQIS